jgi:hypothetical protein
MVSFFQSFGFEACGSDSTLDPGFEKIAIYGNHSYEFTHVACQQPDGTWSSKLGKGRDIIHATLECLQGDTRDEYGSIVVLMKWTIPTNAANVVRESR